MHLEQIGESLMTANGDTVSTQSVIDKNKLILLYFNTLVNEGALDYQKQLTEFYKDCKAKSKSLEIIFVSGDQSQENFDNHFKTMEWYAIPFKSENIRKVAQSVGVDILPSISILNSNGDLVAKTGNIKNGSDIVDAWMNPSLQNKLGGDFVNNKKETASFDELEKKNLICQYFAAGWCPASKGFTPRVIDWYNKTKKEEKNLEVVYVGYDKSQEEFDEYTKIMPWFNVSYDSSKRKSIGDWYNVRKLPCQKVIDNSGKIVKDRAISDMENFGVDAFNVWTEASLANILGKDLINKKGELFEASQVVKGSYIVLWFSSVESRFHHLFLPKLQQWYIDTKKSRDERFELIYVSFDTQRNEIENAMNEMPWLAIPFDRRKGILLAEYFDCALGDIAIVKGDGTILYKGKKWIQESERSSPLFSGQPIPTQSEMIGDDIAAKSGKKFLTKDLAKFDIVCQLFSAQWCPPCQEFAMKLKEFYESCKSNKKSIEIVYQSWDQNIDQFNTQYNQMPWLSLHYGDDRIDMLTDRFLVKSIPKLIVLRGDGTLIKEDGRSDVITKGVAAFEEWNG